MYYRFYERKYVFVQYEDGENYTDLLWQILLILDKNVNSIPNSSPNEEKRLQILSKGKHFLGGNIFCNINHYLHNVMPRTQIQVCN